ncbi:MAG: hypothetical protein K8R54_13260 [Bacteroidales bacterium]|nr:hypothetical protein [Bacteroidales bacterium]
MKFKANSKLDSFWFGAVSGLIVAILITSIIISVNSGDYPVWDHYKHFFDSDDISSILRARVLLSVKGGAIAVLPLFYLFLNKNMYKAIKGLIGIVVSLGILVVYGFFA